MPFSFNFDVNGLVEQLKPAVKAVADSLGTSAGELWKIGAQGMMAQGIAFSILALVALAAVIVGICFIKVGIKTKKANQGRDFGAGDGWLVAGGVLSFMGTVAFSSFAWFAAMYLVAPQYMLVMEILSKLKGGS